MEMFRTEEGIPFLCLTNGGDDILASGLLELDSRSRRHQSFVPMVVIAVAGQDQDFGFEMWR